MARPVTTTAQDNIEATHPSYSAANETWEMIEDLCSGPRKVKLRGERYLPKLHGQEQQDYDSYKKRATFVNFTKRTREALTGMLMRKRPAITMPTEAEILTEDITLAGHTINDWVRMVCEQGVSTGRSLTVIDYSTDKARPYLSHYKASDVLNWASVRENGAEKLRLIVVRECDEELEGFVVEERKRIRRFYLNAEGNVETDLWVETAGVASGTGKAAVSFTRQGEVVQMSKAGKPLQFIPAVFHNASHLGPEIGDSPLEDVAEINLSHYRTSADLENGRHVCGIPTPYATGVSADGDLTLGATKAWTSDNADAKFGFIEFTGQGLASLEKAITEKERQMALLGARLLYTESKEAEAFETVQLRASSETAALSNISGHLSATLTSALKWLIWWSTPSREANVNDVDAAIILNSDFSTSTMQPELMTVLVNALQTNSISYETFYHQLQQGEIYPEDWDLDRETQAISQAGPRTPAMATPAAPGPPSKGTKPDPKAADQEDDQED